TRSLYCSQFPICSYASRRDLHSFPTRRSSDLNPPVSEGVWSRGTQRCRRVHPASPGYAASTLHQLHRDPYTAHVRRHARKCQEPPPRGSAPRGGALFKDGTPPPPPTKRESPRAKRAPPRR